METPEVPLEHAHETMEHHAHASTEPWVMGVALTAAVLAAMAAVTALYAEHFVTEAIVNMCRSPRGLTMFQVGIAVGAISVLTKRREFWFAVSLAFGGHRNGVP